jgi:hypothetical protein
MGIVILIVVMVICCVIAAGYALNSGNNDGRDW